jgi:hypothetical protein
LRKATIIFVVSVCLSVLRPHETTQLSLDGFSLNFIFKNFSKICRKSKFFWSLTRLMGTLSEDHCAFKIVSRWIFLRMRNVSYKICRENQNTHFVFNKFLPRFVPEGTRRYGALHAWCLRLQTHTQNKKYLLLFHSSNGYTNAPQCYIICTLLILFVFSTPLRGSSAGI